jgi:hypothetical protein
MTAFDYTVFLDLSRSMLTDFGREIDLIKYTDTPSDAAKPWTAPSDPGAPVAASVTVMAVSLPPSSASELGLSIQQDQLMQRSGAIYIAEPGTADPDNLGDYNAVRDEGRESKVLFVEHLRPNNLTILYFIGVEQ